MVQGEKGSSTRTCLVCGREYPVCRRCEELKKRGISSWRLNCDTPECFKAFLVLNDYSYGKLSREDARAQLDAILTDEMLPYDSGAKKVIDEIYGVEAQKTK